MYTMFIKIIEHIFIIAYMNFDLFDPSFEIVGIKWFHSFCYTHLAWQEDWSYVIINFFHQKDGSMHNMMVTTLDYGTKFQVTFNKNILIMNAWWDILNGDIAYFFEDIEQIIHYVSWYSDYWQFAIENIASKDGSFSIQLFRPNY
jgi:hypothetical protein